MEDKRKKKKEEFATLSAQALWRELSDIAKGIYLNAPVQLPS